MSGHSRDHYLYIYFLCASAPLLALGFAGHWRYLIATFVFAAIGWLAFKLSSRLAGNLYLQIILGIAICTLLLFALDIWWADLNGRTFALDGRFLFIRGHLTKDGVMPVLLFVGKYALAFAAVVLTWNWLVVKRYK